MQYDSLNNHTFLVTGGSTGLGYGIARHLVNQGASVHICGRRGALLAEAGEKLAAAGSGQVTTHITDIRDASSVDAMFDAIWRKSPLTGLVNNAAANFISPTERLSPRAFDAIANTVMHGTFYVTLAAGKRWIAGKLPGSIVSIVNTGVVNGAPFTVPAVMSKAAIVAMTKSLAIEWGSKNIRLNAVGPGLIPTAGAQNRLTSDNETDAQAQRNPMKRVGTIEELQQLVGFLLSDRCNYLSGQTILLDGAHHLAQGNLFSPLLDRTEEEWDSITARIRAHDAKDKSDRSV